MFSDERKGGREGRTLALRLSGRQRCRLKGRGDSQIFGLVFILSNPLPDDISTLRLPTP